MRLAEHRSEGNDKELITEIVAGVQDPVAPILEIARPGERLHDARRVIERLDEIVDHGTAAIDEDVPRIGTMKIQLGHFSALSADEAREGRPRDIGALAGSGDAVKICKHIQTDIRGKRIIICAPRELPFASRFT
jgi:hypothetical protein